MHGACTRTQQLGTMLERKWDALIGCEIPPQPRS